MTGEENERTVSPKPFIVRARTHFLISGAASARWSTDHCARQRELPARFEAAQVRNRHGQRDDGRISLRNHATGPHAGCNGMGGGAHTHTLFKALGAGASSSANLDTGLAI